MSRLPKSSRPRRASAFRTILAPGFVGVLGLAIALASTVAAHRLVMTAEVARFERLAASAQSALNGRLDADVDAVRAAAGLFAARGELTQAAFERFVRHLSPRWRRRTRSAGWAEKSAVPGPSTFSTGLGAAREFVVRYVHPASRGGVDGVGRDLSESPTVFSAMEKAAAAGKITSSDYVELDPVSHEGGFFTFFPVYRSGARLDTVSDRYEALRGFVFTTRDLDSLIRGIAVKRGVETTVLAHTEHVPDDGPPRRLRHRLFGSDAFDVVRSVRVGDHEWPVRFRSTPQFAEDTPTWLVVVTALVSLIVVALFTGVVWLESRARAEAERTNVRLAESEEALRRASKAKDEFLGVVSHELRNPLGAMAGALRLLRLHRSLEDPAARRAIEIADRQVRQQSRLVDDLLDVTRLATSNILLDIQSLDLGDLLARAVADTRAAASERRHVVSYERPREPIIVEGDAMRLSQIVSNLILNSIKYTPDGGHIDVGLRREGGAAVISVRDDGAGIPEGLLDEVFSPFFQQRAGESASKGLGLGLTIAQRLVALHGGRISASSEGVGHGSEFTVRLPLSERSAASRDESLASVTHSEPPVSGRPITAVVVDDMEDGREILGLLLESLGVAVRDAGTGEEGLGLVHAERPDLMLIDIDLPDMTGLEVARRARRACGDGTLLVAVTGYGAQEDRERAVEAGFDEYLVKPVDVNRLAELVDVLSKRPSAAASAE